MIRHTGELATRPEQVTALAWVACSLFQHSFRELGLEALARLPSGAAEVALRGRPEGCVLVTRAVRAWADGDLGTASRRAEEAVRAFREAGCTREVVEVLYMTGYILCDLGLQSKARPYFEELEQSGRRFDVSRWSAMAATSLGVSALRQKDWSGAETALGRAKALWAMIEVPESQSTTLSYLALAQVRLGQVAEARAHVKSALAAADTIPSSKALALSALAEIELCEKHVAQARVASEQALDLIHAHHLFEDVGLARLVHIQSLQACGCLQEAKLALEEATEWLHERAQRIQDPSLRAVFLTQIPEHAALLSLAQDIIPTVR
jgi:tetratricopeptide (TPR) repeat protein